MKTWVLIFFGLFISNTIYAQAISVAISSDASGNTICSGASVTFTATPTGTSSPLYQWKKNGTAISGATSSTYTTSNLVNGDVISVDMSVGTSNIVNSNIALNLDASNNSSYPGTGTTWTDLSGTGHDAILGGSTLPTFVSSPIKSFQFSRNSDINNGNRIYTASNFLGDDMTVSAWINTTLTGNAAPHYQTMYIMGAEVGGAGNDWGFGVNNDGKLAFGAGTSDNTIATSSSVNTGNWVNVAATRVKLTGEIKLYINGVLNQTGTGNSGNTLTAASQIWIGSGQDGPAFTMGGLINNVLAYTSALSASNILQNYNAQLATYTGISNSNTITTTVKANNTISNFNTITRTYFDGSYVITAPSTNSNGAITYTSSNTSVATISGTTVTIVSAGISTITATQAATATYCAGSISALLTVNSVLTVTKSGEISATNTNYVSRNGSIDNSRGLSSYGQIKNTKTAADGLTSSNPSTSAYQIKQDYPSSADGLYWIANPNINGGAAFQIYADMTTDGGGWTLILCNKSPNNGWTSDQAVLRNQLAPTINPTNGSSDSYSIIAWADYIKKSASGFQYMLEAQTRGANGGIWTANQAYSFVSRVNTNTNITLNTKFGSWIYADIGSTLQPRMPWWTYLISEGLITTDDLGTGYWWGTLVTTSGWNPSPWIENGPAGPGIIWYWVR